MQNHCTGTGIEPNTTNSITHNNHEGAPQPAIGTGAAGIASTAAAPQAPAGGVNGQGGTTPPGQGARPASGMWEGPYQLRDQAKAQRWAKIPYELQLRRQWAIADVKNGSKQPLYYGLSCDASNPNNPIIHHSIRPAKVDNPSTWMSFEAATQWADLYGMEIGFVLTKADPYCIVDLDIKDATPDNIRDGIQKHVEDKPSKHTYVERSTGGLGYHIVVKATLPAGGRRHKNVEIYDDARFMIFTGNVVAPLPIAEGQEYVDGLLRDMGKDAANVPTGYEDVEATKTDEEVLQAACKADNAAPFIALYYRADYAAADTPLKPNGEPDYSQADSVLVQYLCFHTPSNEQVERLWLTSAIGKRPKVLQREKYRKDTIGNIRAKCERDRQQFNANAEHGRALAAPFLEKFDQQQAQKAQQMQPSPQGQPDDEYDMHLSPPTLKDEAFYGILSEIARVGSEGTEAVPAALAMNTLTRFCAAMGPSVYIEIGDTQQAVRPWALIVGPSATGRKGTSAALPEKIFNLVPSAAKTETNLTTGEGLVAMLHDGYTSRGHSVPQIMDKRRLFEISEFASVMAQTKKDTSTLTSQLRDAFDGKRLSLPNKNDPISATNTHVVLVGHITQRELTKYLSDIDMTNGFANRLMMLYSKRTKTVPNPKPTDPRAVEYFAKHINMALTTVHNATKTQRQPIGMDDDARAYWEELYKEIHSGNRFADERVETLMKRADVYLRILSAAIALINNEIVVRRCHLEAAKAWVDYWKDTIEYIFTTVQSRADQVWLKETCDRIVDVLGQLGGKNVPRTALGEKFTNRSASKEWTQKRMDKGLDKLLAEAPPRIKRDEVRTGSKGRPTTMYSLV